LARLVYAFPSASKMRPFPRERVASRLAAASAHPVVVICAPVGSGKSIALDDYLETLEGQFLRFDFSGRGTSIASVLASVERASDHAYEGTIALDGLEVAQRDPAIAGYVVELIERTKERVRWILVTRSSVELPIGTWVAFGDCAPVIGPADLAFTVGEALEAAQWLGSSIEREELEGFVRATNGFPAGIIVALRAGSTGLGRHRAREEVRDVSHRLWAEQVYADTSEEERSLLAVAAVLPEMDVALLERAGFAGALRTIESFRQRSSMLDDAGNGRYRCSDLFKEFLRRQTELLGRGERQAAYARAAAALEGTGNVESALDAYVAAESPAEVLRLLTSAGFELLERGRSDITARAIESLSDTDKQSNPRILALRGALQAVAGNAVRAEALLRRSLSRASDDRDLAASASMRLALLLTNQGADTADLLLPIATDVEQSAMHRAEAWSLLAAQRALAGSSRLARDAMDQIDDLLTGIEAETVQAKVLQRMGVAAMYIGEAERSRRALTQAAALGTERALYSLASRAYANLSNLMLHAFDDVERQLYYAERASDLAARGGDPFDIETAALQLLDAELRYGKSDRRPVAPTLLSSVEGLKARLGGAFPRCTPPPRTHVASAPSRHRSCDFRSAVRTVSSTRRKAGCLRRSNNTGPRLALIG
jgi:ATP/maltotriose-dependent transcriptional regulator MalT